MDARLRTRHTLELDLRNALTAGEFEVYYQPLVTLETGVISGFEALLRWRSASLSRLVNGCCIKPAPRRSLNGKRTYDVTMPR